MNICAKTIIFFCMLVSISSQSQIFLFQKMGLYTFSLNLLNCSCQLSKRATPHYHELDGITVSAHVWHTTKNSNINSSIYGKCGCGPNSSIGSIFPFQCSIRIYCIEKKVIITEI